MFIMISESRLQYEWNEIYKILNNDSYSFKIQKQILIFLETYVFLKSSPFWNIHIQSKMNPKQMNYM